MKEVAWVIFDEVHYMRDRERGMLIEAALSASHSSGSRRGLGGNNYFVARQCSLCVFVGHHSECSCVLQLDC